MKKILTAILLISVPLAAFAQTPSAAPSETTIAASTCQKPELPSSASSVGNSDASRIKPKKSGSNFQQDFDAYKSCVQTYVANQNDLAKKHIAAANAAIGELNSFVTEANDAQGK